MGSSESQDALANQCWRKWAYKYLLGIKEEAGGPLVYGNAGHDTMEALYNGAPMDHAVSLGIDYLNKNNGKGLCPNAYDNIPQHAMGYATHVMPDFLREWRVIATEMPFDYEIAEGIRTRGYIDIVAQRLADNQIGIFDFKFSSEAYMKTLCENLKFSTQFSIYSMAWVRQVCAKVFPDVAPFWPCHVGYHFLLKPKKGDSLEKAKMYPCRGVDIDAAFRNFCVECEANQIRLGLLKRQFKTDFSERGQAALDQIPACFTSCFKYGEMCQFAGGCHNGMPFHTTQRYEDNRP